MQLKFQSAYVRRKQLIDLYRLFDPDWQKMSPPMVAIFVLSPTQFESFGPTFGGQTLAPHLAPCFAPCLAPHLALCLAPCLSNI